MSRSMLEDKIVPKLPQVVPMSPSSLRRSAMALDIQPTPPGHGGIAFYVAAASADDNGTFYMNLEKGGFRRYKALSLLLHEAMPGHHYQYAAREVSYCLPPPPNRYFPPPSPRSFEVKKIKVEDKCFCQILMLYVRTIRFALHVSHA